MKVKVLGVQKVDFATAQGDVIKGTNLYCMYSDENVIGSKTGKFFIKQSIDVSGVSPSSEISIEFNQYGKVSSVTPLK